MIGTVGRLIEKAVLWILVALALLPFLFMLATALQQTKSIIITIDPAKLDFDNFASLFTTLGFGRALITSAIVVVLACVANIFVSSLAAYAFAKMPFPGSEIVFWIYLATMMVPIQVTIIPMFMIMRDLGLLNTYLSLVLPVINAFGVFLIRQFIGSIPNELFESARLDGAGNFRIYVSILLPLIGPVLAALTIFTFITTWNDFLWPLVSITDGSMQTVTLAAANLQGARTTDFGLVMAGATVSFSVPLIVYVLLQRRFVAGIATTGVRG